MFHAFHVDDFVSANHRLQSINARADGILRSMARDFDRAYGPTGGPSIPPEQLIKALVLRTLYRNRSEAQLVEQIGYNFLFRWFLDLKPEDRV